MAAKTKEEIEKSEKKIKPLTSKHFAKGMDGDEDGGGDGPGDDEGQDEEDDKDTEKSKVKKGGVPPQFLKQQNKGKGDAEPDADDEEDGKDMKKSTVSGEDLDKSIAKLNEFTQSNDPASRKEALLSKAQTSDLTKSEQAELFQILGGKAEEKVSLGAQVTKGLTENDDLQKALDVSAYLDSQHTELCKSLKVLGDNVEQSSARQSTFNVVIAKALADALGLIKSMSERQEVIEAQPARGPKSQLSKSKVIEKGFQGREPSDDASNLSKSQILDGLDELMVKSNGLTDEGEDVLKAISKYEQTNQISKSMLSQVIKILGKDATAH